MSRAIPTDMIEGIVGIRRDRVVHYARAITAEKTVYILHSQECLNSKIDLRDCQFSIAMDKGILLGDWSGLYDRTVAIGIWQGRLVPEEDNND